MPPRAVQAADRLPLQPRQTPHADRDRTAPAGSAPGPALPEPTSRRGPMTVTGVCWAGPGAGMGPHCPRGGRIQETGGLPQAARSPAADSPRPGTLVPPGRLRAPCSSGTCPPPSPHAPARRRTCWSVLCGQVSFGLCVHRPPSTDRKCLAGTHLGGRWQRPSSQGTGSVTTDPITLSHTAWGPGRLLPPPTLKHAPGHADTLTSGTATPSLLEGPAG